jgi:hypothetical protein
MAIVGKEIDDDGEIALICRYANRSRFEIDERQKDRFDWLAIRHEEAIAEMLDDYQALIVRWEDEDADATVYLIPRGMPLDDLIKPEPLHTFHPTRMGFFRSERMRFLPEEGD